MPRNIMIGNIMGGGKGITPWLAMKEADTYIKKVNNTAFHSFTFLKYLRFTAMTRNDAHAIFHFGELINRPVNMANSKRKLILTSDDASFIIAKTEFRTLTEVFSFFDRLFSAVLRPTSESRTHFC